MDRRQFIAYTSLAGLGAAVQPLSTFSPKRIKRPGIILGLVGEALEADYESALARLAEMGYREVEFGGHFGPSREAFRNALRRHRLKAVVGGSSIANLKEEMDRHIDNCHFFDKKYLVCYWPWMHSGEQVTLDEVKRTAATFNEMGERCRKEGLKFAFHNHDKEFREVDGQVIYDVFLEETDPELVTMEIDLYWIRKGGGDPIDYFKRYPGRFELCHVKDMDDSADRGIIVAGKGIIDFKEIFRHAKQAGLKHFIVERDRAEDGMKTAAEAAAFLRKLRW